MSAQSESIDRNPELDTWLRVDPEGTVTVFTGKVELGQGLVSAIARLAADELDVSLGRLVVSTADTGSGPDERYTAGSLSMTESGTAVRLAAAEARAALLQLASARLGVPVADLDVSDGTVTARASGRQITYWELLAGSQFGRRITGEAAVKDPADLKLVGKPGPRVDLRGLVSGETRFLHDLSVPGMLHGRVVRPPSPAARLESVDDSGARAVPGVVATARDGAFLGVVAEREEQAVAAAEALRSGCRWTEHETLPAVSNLAEWLGEQPARSEGPTDPVEPAAFEATFTRPLIMHASIGPSAALATWSGDGVLTIRSHAQGVSILREAVAEALALRPESVRIIHMIGPGCYGHNGAEDVALDAALLARSVPGRPVLLKWSRHDEHAWEPYGPGMRVTIGADLDERGRISSWSQETWSTTHNARAAPHGRDSALLAAWHRASPMPPPEVGSSAGIDRNAEPLYSIPTRRVVTHLVESAPLRTSSLRSLGAYANVFAIESFVDELADVAQVDPLDFRLMHLEDERGREVLLRAAAAAGWDDRERVEGSGMGIGFAQYKNSACYAAVIVELDVEDDTAEVRLRRAVVAADAGQVVDPDGLINQLEGGVVQSASWTLKEQVTFDCMRVTSIDWQTYPILTFGEVPTVETVLLDRPGEPFLGAGEATQGPTAAAIANAVFDASGLRVRDLPITPQRLRATAEAKPA